MPEFYTHVKTDSAGRAVEPFFVPANQVAGFSGGKVGKWENRSNSTLPNRYDTKQVSLETAQSHLDTSVLRQLEGKQFLLGCLDLSDLNVETPEVIADRVRKALVHVKPEQIILAPDCGMKYLPREVAQGKLENMVAAAKQLRKEYA